jgi:hypothetical protein
MPKAYLDMAVEKFRSVAEKGKQKCVPGNERACETEAVP